MKKSIITALRESWRDDLRKERSRVRESVRGRAELFGGGPQRKVMDYRTAFVDGVKKAGLSIKDHGGGDYIINGQEIRASDTGDEFQVLGKGSSGRFDRWISIEDLAGTTPEDLSQIVARKAPKWFGGAQNLRETKDEDVTYQFQVRDREGHIKDLITYLAQTANIGHSFSVVVDPDNSEYTKTFYIDGDGSDYIGEVQVIGSLEESFKTKVREMFGDEAGESLRAYGEVLVAIGAMKEKVEQSVSTVQDRLARSLETAEGAAANNLSIFVDIINDLSNNLLQAFTPALDALKKVGEENAFSETEVSPDAPIEETPPESASVETPVPQEPVLDRAE